MFYKTLALSFFLSFAALSFVHAVHSQECEEVHINHTPRPLSPLSEKDFDGLLNSKDFNLFNQIKELFLKQKIPPSRLPITTFILLEGTKDLKDYQTFTQCFKGIAPYLASPDSLNQNFFLGEENWRELTSSLQRVFAKLDESLLRFVKENIQKDSMEETLMFIAYSHPISSLESTSAAQEEKQKVPLLRRARSLPNM